MSGIPATLTSWSAGRMRVVMPPRATYSRLARGGTVGNPGDTAQQRRVLLATLGLLEKDAPQPFMRLHES